MKYEKKSLNQTPKNIAVSDSGMTSPRAKDSYETEVDELPSKIEIDQKEQEMMDFNAK
jgi:hypothetical protein